MDRKVLPVLICACVLAGFITAVYWTDDAPSAAKDKPVDNAPSMASPPSEPVFVAAVPKKTVEQRVEPPIAVSEEEMRVDMPQAITAQLSQIAHTFEEELHYPSYSQPIANASSPYLTPNAFSEVEMPILGGNHSASIVLAQYRFFFPEAVPFKVRSSLPVQSLRYEVIDIESKKVLATGESDSNQAQITGESDWPQQVRLKVTALFSNKGQSSGGEEVLTTDFGYQRPVAKVVGHQPAYADGTDWVIPVDIDATEKGVYRLRANLFKEDGSPVAVLTQKTRLGEGDGEIILKVHKSVLNSGKETYQLKNIQLERMSGRPGEEASYGISDLPVLDLGELNNDALSSDPYQPSEQERQKLEFLKQLAGEA
ncbi:hypothetical protein [Enterovibrio norvegicus]|uniref:Uncharacterized protein n=1 Tax=Enterovibrio norvegicus TaxID=188144 RepID=A0A2N7L379_9GAMM|nr:hypothetical protein [Enterovibrio norvegicus]PMN87373.1 hypothetical protein BCT23_08420 [Enterovibrio norvegicus]